MIYSVLAGIMIAVGGMVNLKLGSVAGAVFFSIGLLSILYFQFDLFTGKAGLIASREYPLWKLLLVWIGNLMGVFLAAEAVLLTPTGKSMVASAQDIVGVRASNGFLANLLLGVFCGVLMYIAVTAYKNNNNSIFVIFPVATFILAGFNHCIADMFYLTMGSTKLSQWLCLIPTTIGNFIGCNLIPVGLRYRRL